MAEEDLFSDKDLENTSFKASLRFKHQCVSGDMFKRHIGDIFLSGSNNVPGAQPTFPST